MGKSVKIFPGKPYPLGATWDGRGVNFAIFSENAKKVELCLFDSPSARSESHRLPLPGHTDMVWNGYIPKLRPGQLYGYRIYGPYKPTEGHRFNPHKILLDPYAKAIGRRLKWSDEMFGYRMGDAQKDLSMDYRDNASHAPLAAVIDPGFDWGKDKPPNVPWHKTLIYELHVKGFTQLHPGVSKGLRGTYAGLASRPSIRHLKKLGITAVELMPIHHHVDDWHLAEKKLSNFWGYNTLSYFAPDIRYSSSSSPERCINEFKNMVCAFHKAGIEVILDVVYNHTAEGNHLGPTLSFRGIDNAAYYRLTQENPRIYQDFTGCGNTLNMLHPRVIQLMMDSLRYWVLEMHVDGFRFDLASALARELYEVNQLSSFFDVIHQDPALGHVKLIAEPWDLGEGGYQVGNFPVGWAEWNARYRDSVRSFWKGDEGTMSEFATRLCGSSDLYEQSGRRPYASINFITCHDGFTLQDLVGYNQKHNEANRENNKDGENHNLSWNCGIEGPTGRREILHLRERQKRNFAATLMLSQGVPMIRGGDELSHTQRGNNNPYCQDNETSWLDWKLKRHEKDFAKFMKRVIKIWQKEPVLKRRNFLQGRHIRGSEVKDITWFDPSGNEMGDETWDTPAVNCFGMRLAGDAIDEINERGERIRGATLLILMNAHHERVTFVFPRDYGRECWKQILDTASQKQTGQKIKPNQSYEMEGRSCAVFRRA